jgi:hypothetical protein
VKAAKWPASGISASCLVGAWISWKYSVAREVRVITSRSPWNRKNGTSRRVPSRLASLALSSWNICAVDHWNPWNRVQRSRRV